MSRIVRRASFVAVLALIAVPITAIGSSAQELPIDDITLTVKKVVSGTGTGPSSVTANCVGNEPNNVSAQFVAVLNFDAEGNPTTSDDEDWEIVDGAWTTSFVNGAGGECDYEETATGGATSTAWTCVHQFDEVNLPASAQIEDAGCEAASGTGTGPVHVVYPGEVEVSSQESTVTFTNTFVAPTTTTQPVAPVKPAAQVAAQPRFTG